MPKPAIASLPELRRGRACPRRPRTFGLWPRTRLSSAFAKVGFSGDYGGTYFLTQLVGSGKAREIYYRPIA